ncbi:MAG: hypothetical protein AAFP84_07350 [Actinomycetota bacterium]
MTTRNATAFDWICVRPPGDAPTETDDFDEPHVRRPRDRPGVVWFSIVLAAVTVAQSVYVLLDATGSP